MTKEKVIAKVSNRQRRHKRLRSVLSGTATRPRLSVYRSNTAVYAQLIDDEKGVTLAAVDSRQEKNNGTLRDKAKMVGKIIAEKAKGIGVGAVVFDRGGFKYQGVIADLAEAARSAGLKF